MFPLGPHLYEALQRLVHGGHRRTYEALTRLLGTSGGETVIEVGCGTGIIARRFVDGGYGYWGFDSDARRCAVASRRVPRASIRVGSALAMAEMDLPRARFYVIHGLLHHLDDAEVRRVLRQILERDAGATLAIVEPYRPEPGRSYPLWRLAAAADEGKHIRTLTEWSGLLAPYLESISTRRLPRWPVRMLDGRLVSP